jgi:hypothetical protein
MKSANRGSWMATHRWKEERWPRGDAPGSSSGRWCTARGRRLAATDTGRGRDPDRRPAPASSTGTPATTATSVIHTTEGVDQPGVRERARSADHEELVEIVGEPQARRMVFPALFMRLTNCSRQAAAPAVSGPGLPLLESLIYAASTSFSLILETRGAWRPLAVSRTANRTSSSTMSPSGLSPR